jgi:DNA-binding transcriptional LysR family regulator
VRVLEPFAPVAPGLFLFYPGNRQMMPKLRAFIDHVKGRSASTNKAGVDMNDERTRRRRKV